MEISLESCPPPIGIGASFQNGRARKTVGDQSVIIYFDGFLFVHRTGRRIIQNGKPIHMATIEEVKESVETSAVDCAAREGPAAANFNMRALIEVASRIARLGYGEPLIDLALRRKGVPPEVARLVAASVTSCNAMILASAEHTKPGRQPNTAVRSIDLRAARAAQLALSKITSFFVFFIAGVGGGAFLGWSLGFSQGVDDGFDWIVRAVERLL
jgi:hypothetical protein